MRQLPHALEINFEDGPCIGMTHAGVTNGLKWQQIEHQLSTLTGDALANLKTVLTWDRRILKSNSNHIIKGIDLVLHGHTVVTQPIELGNRIYFDTGAYLAESNKKFGLTVLKYNKQKTGTLGTGWLDKIRCS